MANDFDLNEPNTSKMNTDEVDQFESPSSIHIHNFPDHMMLDIFSWLEFRDVCKCARVCRRWLWLTKDFALQRKIVIKQRLSSDQLYSIVQHHFTDQLEEFQLLNSEKLMPPVSDNILHWIKSNSSNIKKLVFMSCCLVNVVPRALPSKLTHISFRGSQVFADRFFKRWCFSYLPLVCLDVGGVTDFLTSQDLVQLKHLKHLRALYLEGCFRVNNGGIESIIDILPQLLVLDVEGTDISNEGAICIFNHCKNAQDLFLGHNIIDNGAFVRNGFNVPCLTTLCVRDTDVNTEFLQSFLKKHTRNQQLKIITNKINISGAIVSERVDFDCKHYLSHKTYGLN